MKKALFLDRDGVLDELVFHSDTGGWEAPRTAGEMRVRPGVREALDEAVRDGWTIIVVSNQPDAAKGRTTRAALDEAHRRLLDLLGHPPIADFYYCFHRAEDGCACRKPQPRSVLDAAAKHDIDLSQSWFAGDMDTDIECGRRAGLRTALLEYEHSSDRRGNQRADLVCRDLGHFVRSVSGRTSDDDHRSED